jgi:hypothetical protein
MNGFTACWASSSFSSTETGTRGEMSIASRVRPDFSSPRSRPASRSPASCGLKKAGSQPFAISPVCSIALGPMAPR